MLNSLYIAFLCSLSCCFSVPYSPALVKSYWYMCFLLSSHSFSETPSELCWCSTHGDEERTGGSWYMCLQMSPFRVCSSKMLNKLFHHYVTMVKECNNIITGKWFEPRGLYWGDWQKLEDKTDGTQMGDQERWYQESHFWAPSTN